MTNEEIALFLCGYANKNFALDFMQGGNPEPFLSNVAYNGEESASVILEAIRRRERVKMAK